MPTSPLQRQRFLDRQQFDQHQASAEARDAAFRAGESGWNRFITRRDEAITGMNSRNECALQIDKWDRNLPIHDGGPLFQDHVPSCRRRRTLRIAMWLLFGLLIVVDLFTVGMMLGIRFLQPALDWLGLHDAGPMRSLGLVGLTALLVATNAGLALCAKWISDSSKDELELSRLQVGEEEEEAKLLRTIARKKRIPRIYLQFLAVVLAAAWLAAVADKYTTIRAERSLDEQRQAMEHLLQNRQEAAPLPSYGSQTKAVSFWISDLASAAVASLGHLAVYFVLFAGHVALLWLPTGPLGEDLSARSFNREQAERDLGALLKEETSVLSKVWDEYNRVPVSRRVEADGQIPSMIWDRMQQLGLGPYARQTGKIHQDSPAEQFAVMSDTALDTKQDPSTLSASSPSNAQSNRKDWNDIL